MTKDDKLSRVIVALDTPNLEDAKGLVKELKGVISYFKIGTELFTAHGWEAVNLVQETGNRVFLDLKLHDIPNTVSKTVAVLAEHSVEMITLHSLGGLAMMRKTMEVLEEAAAGGKGRPKVVAVTVLTSHSENDLARDLGIQRPLDEQVSSLAKLAQTAGLEWSLGEPHY